jgi:hypothetical protein
MNPANVEKAFAAALRETITSVSVLQGTGSVELPESAAYIVVFTEQCENVVGPLWKATVAVNIISPAPLTPETDHASVVAQIVSAMTSAALFSRYNQTSETPVAGHTCVGGKLLNSEGEPDNGAFRHTVKILLGLVTAAS